MNSGLVQIQNTADIVIEGPQAHLRNWTRLGFRRFTIAPNHDSKNTSCTATVVVLAGAVAVAQDQAAMDLRAADNQWNDGNYIAALTAYIRLLNSPSGDQYLEPIALQTGELLVTEGSL